MIALVEAGGVQVEARRVSHEAVDAAEGLEENITLLKLALERMVRIREQSLSGLTYSEIADHSDLPHFVEIFRTSLHLSSETSTFTGRRSSDAAC